MILQDGDVAIFIEVNTKLETADVRKHLEQMEKYRRHVDAAKILWPPTTRFLGAVAGAVVDDDAMDFAHENGLYVIVHSGEAVEIVPTPEGFAAKEWERVHRARSGKSGETTKTPYLPIRALLTCSARKKTAESTAAIVRLYRRGSRYLLFFCPLDNHCG